MKKSKCFILPIGTFLIVIIIVSSILVNHMKKDDKTSELSVGVSQEEKDTGNSKKIDGTTIETIEEGDYTILLRGSARPKNGEIIVEDAAKIGVEELEKEYNINANNSSVEMIFLDGLVTDTGTWSGHIILGDNEKYEFLLDGKNGNIEYLNKND